jgi:riboflavin kinase/FMN adenylyltransferase
VPAAISIGTTPTFGEGPRQIEAFLLDFEGDVYEQRLRLDFLRWLRPQVTYATPEALIEQMDRDVEEVRSHAHDAEVERNGKRGVSREP